jgi:hypothetical protein
MVLIHYLQYMLFLITTIFNFASFTDDKTGMEFLKICIPNLLIPPLKNLAPLVFF